MRYAFVPSFVVLALLAATAGAQPAKDGGPATSKALIAPSPVPVRVALADMLVTGKVTKIEDKTVSAPAFPAAKDKVEYQIAVVKVEDPILNAKGVKEVRVGFVVPMAGVVRPGSYRPPTLADDEEVLLFLTKHFDADFYYYPAYYDVVKKANNQHYEKELEEAKKAAKLIADPTAGLKSKQAEDRYLTAAMLIERYRTSKPSPTPPKQETIDAEESKLILEALRDADWTPPGANPGGPAGWKLTPQLSFSRLALTKEDNWTPPADAAEFADAAKAWLKDNAGTYRIKKLVPETKEKEPQKKDK
jgi:hypothetical protein